LNSLDRELMWFGSFLIAFIALLMIGGIPDLSELVIALAAFTVSWCLVSLSIKRFGAGGTDRGSMQKELIWFGGILIGFLGLLTIVSQEDGGMGIWAYLIVISAFSITWIIRSYAAKRF
jgi:hypothetical protein